MIENKYNEEEHILYVTITGEVQLQDMLDALGFIISSPELPRNLKILENATNAKIVFKVEELELIVEKLNECLLDFDSIQHAVIHSQPIGSAFVIIITKMIHHSGYVLKDFSTETAAKSWLKNHY